MMKVAKLKVSGWGEAQLDYWLPVRSLQAPDGTKYDEVVLGRPNANGIYPLSVWLDRNQPPTVTRHWRRWMSRGVESVHPTLKGSAMHLKAPNAIVAEHDLEPKDGDILLAFDTHFARGVGDGEPGLFQVTSNIVTYEQLAVYRSPAYETGFVVVRPGLMAVFTTEHTGEKWDLVYPNQRVGLLLTRQLPVGVLPLDPMSERYYRFAHY